MTGLGRRPAGGLLVLLGAAGVVVLLRALVYRDMAGELSWAWPGPDVARFRFTAIVVAIIVGTALAVSGVLLQALLRNPLASPFILGVSGGAALGVMVAVYVAYAMGLSGARPVTNTVPALLGALGALALVYGLGQRRGWLDPISLILIGVVVSSICGSLIMLLQHLVPEGQRGQLITWMFGSIPQGVPPVTLAVMGTVTAAGVVIGVRLGRAMDASTLGDDEARTVGVALGPLRITMFLIAGALAALAVCLAGPIGFVGLVAPHVARLLLGPRHAVLVIGATLVGVILLVGGDVASQAIRVDGGRIPVGVFTALVGGPAFLWLLRSGRGTP